ncbi:MAG: hypothetical protein LC657_09555, partial [Desulfobacteraceae bacterium]|nr:hypothetical protein [Desulfobacteraceae bacterium]
MNQSKTLLDSIPDYYALIPALTDLMACYLQMKDYEKAYAELHAAKKLVTEKHLKGFILSIFYNAVCEFY